MSHYRRAHQPGGVFFFTVVTRNRRPLFTSGEPVGHLRTAFRRVRDQRPFTIDAIVVLPDHLHCIWRLPEGDDDYAGRWREIKKTASRAIAPRPINHRRERAVWQRRYWEHAIRGDADWRRHVDYIHYNPVKHGFAEHPRDWPWSSFHRYVARGDYPPDWGATEPPGLSDLTPE